MKTPKNFKELEKQITKTFEIVSINENKTKASDKNGFGVFDSPKHIVIFDLWINKMLLKLTPGSLKNCRSVYDAAACWLLKTSRAIKTTPRISIDDINKLLNDFAIFTIR